MRHNPEPCPEVVVRNTEVLIIKTISPIPHAQADGYCIYGKVDVQGHQAIEHRSCPFWKVGFIGKGANAIDAVSYTHLRAHETDSYLVCRLLLEKKKKETEEE